LQFDMSSAADSSRQLLPEERPYSMSGKR